MKYILLSAIAILMFSCNSLKRDQAFKLEEQAMNLIMNRNYDSALIILDKAIEMDKSYYSAYRNKAQVYLRKKEYNKALEINEEILKMLPESDMDWTSQGLVYDQIFDSINAKRCYLKSIQILDKKISETNDIEKVLKYRLDRAFMYILTDDTSKGKAELKELKGVSPEYFMIDSMMLLSRKELIEDLRQ